MIDIVHDLRGVYRLFHKKKGFRRREKGTDGVGVLRLKQDGDVVHERIPVVNGKRIEKYRNLIRRISVL